MAQCSTLFRRRIRTSSAPRRAPRAPRRRSAAPPRPAAARRARSRTPRRRSAPCCRSRRASAASARAGSRPRPAGAAPTASRRSGRLPGSAGASLICTLPIRAPGIFSSCASSVGPRNVCHVSNKSAALARPLRSTIASAVAASGMPDHGRYSSVTSRPCSRARSQTPASASAARSTSTLVPKPCTALIERAPTPSAIS